MYNPNNFTNFLGMPPPFPTVDDEEDNQGDLDDDDEPTTDDIYPPALPPKRGPLTSRSFVSHAPPQRSFSHEERIIPIVIEGHKRRPHRQESNSSVMSANAESPIQPLPQVHRFSADSMNSSTSSSGLGTDIHSLRQSLPSPVLETSHAEDTTASTANPVRFYCIFIEKMDINEILNFAVRGDVSLANQ